MRVRLAAGFIAAFLWLPTLLAAQDRSGIVRGRVTEVGTGTTLVAAQVSISGTRLGTLTDADGRYVVRGVAAGTALVRVVRLGYQPLTKTVQLSAGGDVSVDFALDPAVKTLDAVVTTATGEQSRRSYGNVVATLKVDSLAEKAAATNVNELLQGRVAGVQVIQGDRKSVV